METYSVRTPTTMQAVVQDRYGEADVLHPAPLPVPQPGSGQVLLEVQAAGVDRGAWHLMAGRPYAVRLVTGLRRPRKPVRGREVAGRVVALGADVEGVAVGDEVYGIAEGTFAQYACGKAAKLAQRPAGVTPAQAATLPISGLTALQAVRDAARVAAGERVLVIGASGGVGSLAVQLAVARGADVTGLASAGKLDLVAGLGARALDRASVGLPSLAAAGERFDVVIDTGGGRPLRELRSVLTPRGRLVIVGSEEGGKLLGLGRPLRAAVWSLVSRRTMVMLVASERGDDLRELAGLVASGAVRPVLDRAYPLEQAAEAMRHLTSGRARGKVAVTPAP